MPKDWEDFRHYENGDKLLDTIEHLQFEKLEWEDEAARVQEELEQTQEWLEQRTNQMDHWHSKYRALKSDFDEKVPESQASEVASDPYRLDG